MKKITTYELGCFIINAAKMHDEDSLSNKLCKLGGDLILMGQPFSKKWSDFSQSERSLINTYKQLMETNELTTTNCQ